eukprot:2415875-Lingulodinium_polyedra.AAC.1
MRVRRSRLQCWRAQGGVCGVIFAKRPRRLPRVGFGVSLDKVERPSCVGARQEQVFCRRCHQGLPEGRPRVREGGLRRVQGPVPARL